MAQELTDTSEGCKPVVIPEGMIPWHGGDLAPDDWNGGDVLLRDGSDGVPDDWRHLHGIDDDGDCMSDCDIIAYWPIDEISDAAEDERRKILTWLRSCLAVHLEQADRKGQVTARRHHIEACTNIISAIERGEHNDS